MRQAADVAVENRGGLTVSGWLPYDRFAPATLIFVLFLFPRELDS
jgi:hypothetical protein